MGYHPLIPFRSTKIYKAFILNAIVLTLVATISIELRRFLDIRKETSNLLESQKLIITMIGTFIVGIITYLLARFLFGYGEGLLASKPYSGFLF